MKDFIPINRIIFILFLCVGFELIIVGKLIYLQFFRFFPYEKKVEEQSQVKVKIQGRRGRIYDRFYRILATSIDNKRVYPNKEKFSSVLGLVSKDNIGLEGIEYKFNNFLKSKFGIMVFGRTPRGWVYPYPGYLKKEAKPGKDIVLTIDNDIQSILYYAIKKRMDEMRAKRGAGLIINPKTGEILAMVSISNQPYRNINVQDQFEPGSIFKIAPLSYIIKENLVDLTDTVEDGTCYILVKGKKINDVRLHKAFTFEEAVWHSSNVAFVKLSKMLGKEKFYESVKLLGFGTKTGIDFPGEEEGSISKPEKWDELSFANISFGQGIATTLIQVAFAYQAIANDGILLKPIILKEILSPDGKIIYKSKVKKVRKVFDKEVAQRIIDILCGVIEKGSGIFAKIPNIKIAGKTGTANKVINGRYVDKYISSFVAFFPAEDPKFLVAVMIDEPQVAILGGIVCSPIIKEVAQKLIKLAPYNRNET